MMKIRFHFTFWLLAFVFLFSGLYFELLIFFSVILLHEGGHLLWCFLFKKKVYSLNITAAGGLMSADIEGLTFIKQILLYSGGILVNILLLFLSRYIRDDYCRMLIYNFNLLMILFNALPAYPLDGYKILDAVLSAIINRPFREQKILLWVSTFALIICFYFIMTIKCYAFLILLFYVIIRNFLYHMNNSNHALRKLVMRYRLTYPKFVAI